MASFDYRYTTFVVITESLRTVGGLVAIHAVLYWNVMYYVSTVLVFGIVNTTKF